jgi:hypothetical protein
MSWPWKLMCCCVAIQRVSFECLWKSKWRCRIASMESEVTESVSLEWVACREISCNCEKSVSMARWSSLFCQIVSHLSET